MPRKIKLKRVPPAVSPGLSQISAPRLDQPPWVVFILPLKVPNVMVQKKTIRRHLASLPAVVCTLIIFLPPSLRHPCPTCGVTQAASESLPIVAISRQISLHFPREEKASNRKQHWRDSAFIQIASPQKRVPQLLTPNTR